MIKALLYSFREEKHAFPLRDSICQNPLACCLLLYFDDNLSLAIKVSFFEEFIFVALKTNSSKRKKKDTYKL